MPLAKLERMYPSRSEVDLAFASWLAEVHLEDEEKVRGGLENALWRPKFDEVHYADGTTYLRRVVEKALAPRDEKAARWAIAASGFVLTNPLPRVRGYRNATATDRAVLTALLAIAKRHGVVERENKRTITVTFHASCRKIAELAGTCYKTVANALKRLQERTSQWAVRVKVLIKGAGGLGSKPAITLLKMQLCVFYTTDTHTHEGGGGVV